MMANKEKSNTVIRNTNSLKENSNTVLRNTKDRIKIQKIAEYYVQKLNAPKWRSYFLKAAWYLNEDTIATIYERAIRRCPKDGDDILKYFIKSCSREMSMS